MGIILILHIFLQLMMIPVVAGFLLVIPGMFALAFALVAHYTNVVNEIGVEANDELPRPLRDLSWSEDIWGPFVHFFFAAMICYGPILFYHEFPKTVVLPYILTVLFFGTIGFPAIFLTTATSGTVLNLSPDRVLGVISAMGLKYLIAIGLWAVAAVLYLAGIGISIFTIASVVMTTSSTVPAVKVPIFGAYAMLLVGIVLMHAFCWYLGLLYRAHYDQFNWFLQRHHRTIQPLPPTRGMVATTPAMAAPVATPVQASQSAPPYPQSHA
jgi:hypothetical protein